MKQLNSIQALVLAVCLLSSISAVAAESYTNYTPEDSTLTFYYDNLKSSRNGRTYYLNRGYQLPEWFEDNTYETVRYVVFDPSFANAQPTLTSSWFREMRQLQSITGMEEYLNTSKVTNMQLMFYDCYSLTSLDVSNFNTQNVTNMSSMFSGCSSLTSLDVSNFNTANVTDVGGMFYDCYNLTSLDVSNFNTAKVTDMGVMFYNCNALTSLDVSNFNTAKVTNMNDMFYGCNSLTSLDVSNFNTQKVTGMYEMFYGCSGLTSLNVSNFDTQNVIEMWRMFSGCRGLTSLDVRNFDTQNVTRMDYMFYACKGLTSLDLSSFNTQNVTDMSDMFCGSDNLVSIYIGSGWSTANVTSSNSMFLNCSSLVGGMGTTYDSNYTNVAYAHIDEGPNNPGYMTGCPEEAYANYTPDNTTLTFYFDNKRSMRPGTTFDLNTGEDYPEWYNDGTYLSITEVVVDLSFSFYHPVTTNHWFCSMTELQSITGLTYVNTDCVTNMSHMFTECGKLTSLDLSNFSTDQVTDMGWMFTDCSNLYKIFVSRNWSTESVNKSTDMFKGCYCIDGHLGTSYDAVHVDATYAHIDGGTNDPGYLTELLEAYVELSWENHTLTFYYDDLRSSRTGKTFDLNEAGKYPEWYYENYVFGAKIALAVFDPSFIGARPTTTDYWFYQLSNLENIIGLNYLNTAKVTSMRNMFNLCTALTSLDMSNFNTQNVIYMNGMFVSCRSLTSLDVSNFNTQNVTNMSSMFSGCSSLTSLDLSNFNTANAENLGGLFYGCSGLTSLDLSSFNTTNVTNMRLMFYGCSGLTSLDLSNFNTQNVTNMYEMFYGCSGLTSLDVSNFNTQNVTNMYGMFYGCSDFTSLDLSSFNTTNVTNMDYMFFNCSNLATIHAGSEWSTETVTSSSSMFGNCTNLVGGMGTTYDASHVDKTYAHIDGGTSNPGYFTAKNAALRGDVDGDSSVNISDVTALIDYLLSGNASGINLSSADCDQDSSINISDVTALIDYLLSGTWN